jgi:hypothetical protein
MLLVIFVQQPLLYGIMPVPCSTLYFQAQGVRQLARAVRVLLKRARSRSWSWAAAGSAWPAFATPIDCPFHWQLPM